MTKYSIEYKPSAAKTIRKLPKNETRKIIEAIGRLAENPRPHGAKKLVGGQGEMRIRVGNYRVIYEVLDSVVTIYVLKVGHRREIYR